MSAQLPVEGQCMCGQVRMRISVPPVMTMACHCKGCQKLSASAFSLTAMIPTPGFEVLAGEPQIGAMHGASQYFYCPNCLNWLFTRPAGFDFAVNVRPTMFGIEEWSTPFVETFASEKLPWAFTAAHFSFDQYPPQDQYGMLMGEYASLHGRIA
jgi:hypothetical protein